MSDTPATIGFKPTSKNTLILASLVLLIITGLLQLPQTNSLNIDASVFWYEGQQILKGKIPYRDLWDHKTPLIYYFNALCLLILPVKIQALRIVSILLSFGTSLCLYITLRRLFSSFNLVLAVVVLFTFYLNSHFLDSGLFYTENLQIFFNALTFLFLVRWFQTSKFFDLALTGLFCSLALLSKQTELGLISISLLLLVYRCLELKKKEKFLQNSAKLLACFSVPLLLPPLGFVLYFSLNGAWRDLLDQNLTYNQIYVGNGNISLWDILDKNLHAVSSNLTYLAWLAGLAILAFLWRLREKSARQKLWQQNKFLVFSFVWACIDFFSIDLSLRNYAHYYLQLLIPFIILISYALRDTITLFQRVMQTSPAQRKLIATLILMLPALALAFKFGLGMIVEDVAFFNPKLSLTNTLFMNGFLETNAEEISSYLQAQDPALANQTIYVWGRGAQIFFYTGVSSPSRFFYNLPLLTPNYATPAIHDEFVQDLEKTPPAYFIDTGVPDYIFPVTIPPENDLLENPDKDLAFYPLDPLFRKQLQDFLSQHYTLDKVFNSNTHIQINIYRLTNN
jgi:4-amino-4-deoxy-L-arabinose transferase-like glycosyltransferase